MGLKVALRRGVPTQLGSHLIDGGVNFAIYSDSPLSLLLFEPGQKRPFARANFEGEANRTGKVYHCLIDGLPPGCEYGYQIDPSGPLLCDPYSRRLATSRNWGEEEGWRSVIPDGAPPFDWAETRRPATPWSETILYEMHLRGFTQDPSSGVAAPGSFLGAIEKIPYLKALGITAVELLPIFEFNENDIAHLKTRERLYNYWGYSPLHLFYPMGRYAQGDPIEEFRTLVCEMHRAGIEVILDVVYNHTGEHAPPAPAFAYRDLAESSYYLLDGKGEPRNDSGCGNTLNTNHPVCSHLILESLRYWVGEMGVDGFRFDLASILTRGEDGAPMAHPPIIEAISKDPLLAETKLIAEAWDAAGLYQVGHFPGERWSEWNGKFRDDVREFIKGKDGMAGRFATRIGGSQDLYHTYKRTTKSINFVTAHDGFTLRDLVSYNQKHNEANGEENRDGDSSSTSWNCGVEGKSSDPEILALRSRQMRNLHLALMLSRGVPMLSMGDEYGHTRGGNNNPYCHDGPINWFQWKKIEEELLFWRFYSGLIEFRKSHPILSGEPFFAPSEIQWHGHEPLKANWGGESRFVAFSLIDPEGRNDLYAAFNASSQIAHLYLPEPVHGYHWSVRVNTSEPPPHDYYEEGGGPSIRTSQIRMLPHSALLLEALPAP